MSRMNEKAVLRVNSDGDVIKCAKGLPAADCGWKPGDKVCGACGAMAVMTKGGTKTKSASGRKVAAPMDEEMPMPAPRRRKPGAAVVPSEEMPEEMPEEEPAALAAEDRAALRRPRPVAMEDEEEAPEEGSEDSEEELQRAAKIKKYRKMRLGGMGVKDATGAEGMFLCGTSRKMLPGGSEPCEGCTGGCFPVAGMPDLLAVEGMAMREFGGKVLDSGYSGQYDTFVVDVRRKDGRIIEAYYNGRGEPEGWHPIPEESVGYSDAIVGGDEAVIAALGQIEGKALEVAVQLVDGKPAYRVEVDGKDGYSYDVFVGLDGKVLGLDQWEYETSALAAGSVKSGDIEVSLMEFEALATEQELREIGLI